MLEAIILAGGLGTRLRSIVTDVPKPMAPISGRPFLEFILERLEKYGFEKVIISVGYKSEVIISHFGNQFGNLKIAYSVEEEALGTGGAITLALKSISSENVFILNGDTYADIDYHTFREGYLTSKSLVGMALTRMENCERYGTCTVENSKVVSFAEKQGKKPGLINCGVYCINRNLFVGFNVPAIFSFERDFVQLYLSDLKPFAYISSGYFIDIGIPEDFLRAQLDLASY